MQQIEKQMKYYKETVNDYDKTHVGKDEHYNGIKLMEAFIKIHNLKTFLDIGAGTGRTMLEIEAMGLKCDGLEPSPELMQQAIKKGVQGDIYLGYGEETDFKSESYDAVCEFGVLHHVARPEKIVSEMLRIAKKAVFISDNNRYGYGNFLSKNFKLSVHSLGFWEPFYSLKTLGKGYEVSKGDGLHYSYSVYDSYKQVAKWADEVHVIGTRKNIASPLFGSTHALLVGIRH